MMARPRGEIAALMALLLVAAVLRLYRLDSVPPGMTHDEADTGYFVAAVYRGEPADIDAPYGYANEKLSMYSGALWMALAGPTDLALRLHSAFFGLLMLVFGFLWLRTAFDPTVALVATALTAVSFWTIATARFALNPQPAPALFAGSVWLLWRAWLGPRDGRGRWTAAVLAGLLLAGSLWTYEVARATAAAIIALVVWLALVDRAALRRGGWSLAVALTLGLGLAAPHLLNPAAWQRTTTLATAWRALLGGDLGPLLATLWEGLGILFVRGDPFVTYNLPGRPLMGPLVGALFLAGLVLCLCRWRQPAPALALLWLAFGLGPVLLTGAYTATLHAMGIQPIVYLFPALAAVEGVRWIGRRHGRRARHAAGVLLALLIVAVALVSIHDYFVRWARLPETAAAYFHDLAEATDYLQDRAPAGVVTLSSPFPDLTHDPFVADLRVHRDDVTLRWADGRTGLVYPPADDLTDQFLLVIDRAPLADPLLPPGLVPLHRGEGFTVYRWDPVESWQALPRDEAFAAQGAGLGGVLSLTGYSRPPPGAAGAIVTVSTLWRVDDPTALGPVPARSYGHQAALFVHLLDDAGEIIAQDDRLAVPAWGWQAGDHLAQIFTLTLPADVASGKYRLVAGAYTRPAMVRLALPTGDDGYHLGLLEVESQ